MRAAAMAAGERLSPIPLYDAEESGEGVEKAAIVPFRTTCEGGLEFYLMKPRPNPAKSYDALPQWQLCKGTYEQEDKTLKVTALREGYEEIGLNPARVTHMFDGGVAQIISESSWQAKPLQVYFVEVLALGAFGEPDPTEGNTADRGWIDIASAGEQITPSHLSVLQRALSVLQEKSQGRGVT